MTVKAEPNDNRTTAPAGSPAADARRLAAFIETHAPLFVLTGAGCSTASGIPDYRDEQGEWKHARPVQYSDFIHSGHVRRRYWARSVSGWPRFEQSKPNAAHRALARLERAGLLSTLCTQNVDALHQKAGSVNVIDLHGRLDQVECLDCETRLSRARLQQRLVRLNPDHGTTVVEPAPDGDAYVSRDIDGFTVVNCDHCGGFLKPTVVFFGENVPVSRVTHARRALERSGGMLVVGSSLMVYSGYRFCRIAESLHLPLAAVNRGRTRADGMLSLKIAADCGPLLDTTTRLLLGH